MDFEQLEKSRILAPVEGYSPHIGILIASLEYSRLKIMGRVAHLTIYELDYRHDERANSIGSLLLHMAAVEFATQQQTFYGHRFFEKPGSLGKWELPLFLGERAWREIRGHPVEYYFEEMAEVRQHTLEQFAQYDDDWLWQERPWKRGIVTNHYWQWYHVFEDEMAHRGEISWLMSRIPPAV